MKNLSIFLISIFFCFFSVISAQIPQTVKQKVDAFPDKISKVGYLAGIINNAFDNDSDKAEAIFYWMANYFDYDVKKHFSKHKKYAYNFRYKNHDQKEKKMHKADWGMYYYSLRKHKATYRGYAYLYKQLCNNVGLQCEIISGTAKNSLKSIGRKSGRRDHMWNAVKINDKWQLVDVVYGSGRLNEEKKTFTKSLDDTFLFTPPQLFFLNHYPKKSKWLLCEKGKQDFAFLPLYYRLFLQSGLKLESPQNGVISETNDGSDICVELKINSNENAILKDDFSYSYQSVGSIKNIKVMRGTEDTLILKIPVSSRKMDYLNIFINKRPLISYKIKLS